MDNRPKPRLVYGELGQLYALHGEVLLSHHSVRRCWVIAQL